MLFDGTVEGWSDELNCWTLSIDTQAKSATTVEGVLRAVAAELRLGHFNKEVATDGRFVRLGLPRPPSEYQTWASWLTSTEPGRAAIQSATTPRPLTVEEIEWLTAPFQCAASGVSAQSEDGFVSAAAVNFPEVWRHGMRAILESMYSSLSSLKVPPAALGDLRHELANQFRSSLVAKGEAVGIRAAEAFGQPLTQMALNAFHSSGALNTIGEDNIVKMRELFNNSLQMKNETCRVGFSSVTTLHEALHRKKDITDTRLNKFFRADPELVDSGSQDSGPLHHIEFLSMLRDRILGGVSAPSMDASEMLEKTSALGWGTSSCGNSSKGTFFLRLSLDVNAMYQYRLTTQDIVRRIEDSCVLGSVVRFQLYPTHVGRLDIYPTRSTAASESHAKVFLMSVLLPELINVRMCGIPGIENIIPEEVNVLNATVEAFIERDKWLGFCAEADALDRSWSHFAFVNTSKLTQHRLRVCDVERFLKNLSSERRVHLLQCPRRCLTHSEKYLVYAIQSMTLAEVASRVGVADLAVLVEDNRKVFEGNEAAHSSTCLPPKVVVELLQSYGALPEINSIFVSTVGANLEALLMRDDVDASLTFSNNVRQINELFGIEAARSVLITEFWKLLERSGSKISPRHVLLVADFMTNRGVVLGLTSSGLSLQPSATLTLMTFERPADHIFRMGMTGNEETINSVSSCVMTGQPPMVGTGSSGIRLADEDMIRSNDHQERYLAGVFPFGRGKFQKQQSFGGSAKRPTSSAQRARADSQGRHSSAVCVSSTLSSAMSSSMSSRMSSSTSSRMSSSVRMFDEFEDHHVASTPKIDSTQGNMFDEFDEAQPQSTPTVVEDAKEDDDDGEVSLQPHTQSGAIDETQEDSNVVDDEDIVEEEPLENDDETNDELQVGANEDGFEFEDGAGEGDYEAADEEFNDTAGNANDASWE